MADPPRPAFRPQRARASLSALPSSTLPSASALLPSSKHNADDASTSANLASSAPGDPAQKRKKRAQSLGGDALDGARKRSRGTEELRREATVALELSPGKMERRRAAPRRSILKAVPAVFDLPAEKNNTLQLPSSRRASLAGAVHAHTTDLGSLSQNTEANAAPFEGAVKRRASIARRSSIAAGGAAGYDDSDDSFDSDEGSDMDITRNNMTSVQDSDGRRYSVSHSRRVSFAPSAHIRTYTPDKMTADAQALARAVAAQQKAAELAAQLTGEGNENGQDESFSSNSSMAFSDAGNGGEGDVFGDAAGEDDLQDDQPNDDADNSLEISHDFAAKGGLRFGKHFEGTNVPADALDTLLTPAGADDSVSTASDADEDGTMAMDEVTLDGSVTAAFASATGAFHLPSIAAAAPAQQKAEEAVAAAQAPAASIYPSLSALSSAPLAADAPAVLEPGAQLPLFGASAPSTSKARPRPSVVAREEDADDEAILRELGFAKGGKPRKSRIAFEAVPEEQSEDEEEDADEVMEDATGAIEDGETGAMDLTVAVGGVLSSSASASQQSLPPPTSDPDYDSDAEVSMQLTGAVNIAGADRTMDMTFASEAAPLSDLIDAEQSVAMDETATMAEATTYGGILSQSLLSSTRQNPPPVSPGSIFGASRRASIAPPGRRASSPPKRGSPSPAPAAPARAESPPKVARGTTPTGFNHGTQSPFRRHTLAPSSPQVRRSSPLPSPRRISVSPAPPAAPPAEEQPAPAPQYAPPSSLAVPAPKSPARHASASPAPGGLPAGVSPRSRSRSRSLSPVKTRSSVPPAAEVQGTPTKPAGTTASGTATFNPRTLAPPQSAGRSPGGSLSLRALLSGAAEESRKARAAGGDKRKSVGGEQELELTGSEFEGSFDDGRSLPAPPASLTDFFGEVGISFVDDILGLAGVDLKQGRRKSVAPTPGRVGEEEEREPAGPPSFADLAVAGACKSLFYQLYQSDQLRLGEGINDAHQMYTEHAAAIAAAPDAQKPRVFKDWANATDEARLVMQSQFRQIKLYFLLQGQLEWKECRKENYQQIIQVMQQNLEGLKEDRAKLAEVEIASVIPSLEERHAALQADLLAERKLDAELSSYSPEDAAELQGMYEAMEEVDGQLNGNPDHGVVGLRPELDRIEQQLLSYRDTLDKYTTEEARLQAEIAEYEERRRDKRTKADLLRLQAEFDALQRVQGWELVRFSAQAVCMRHWDEFEVTLELVPGSLKARNAEFELKYGGKAARQVGAQVTAFLLAKISDEVARMLDDGEKDARSLLRLISSRSTTLRHIRHEVALTSLRYPTTARLITASSSSADPVLELDIDVFCPATRNGFAVVVPLTAAEVVDAPSVDDWARGISASVKPRFGGNINALALAQTVNDRLEGGDARGALLEAVRAAEEECDQA